MTFSYGLPASLEDLVLDRLKRCAEDFGVKRAWAQPPSQKIQREDLPCVYGLLGPTYDTTLVATRGFLQTPRVYIQRLLLMPFAGGADDLAAGAEANGLASRWATIVRGYYHSHPTLHTTALPALRFCKGVEDQADTGIVIRTAPGGTLCAAIDFSLSIVMAAALPVAPIPYGV